MGQKSLHLNGKEVYIVEATDRIDTWIAYGLFIDDKIPASGCFPFYSLDGRISECQWEMPHANDPPKQVPMFCNPFNSIYFNIFDIDWPDYCFTFKNPKEWSPIKGYIITFINITLSSYYINFCKILMACVDTGV